MSEWISVKERLPIVNDDVLIVTYSGKMWTGYWALDWWADNNNREIYAVTHWMPLPFFAPTE